MAGRKPLPAHLKLVKGTARPHRLNKGEPKPAVAVPQPPAHLDERATAKFAAMAEMLARHEVMTELDAGALAPYAVVWCRWIEGPRLRSSVAAVWSRPGAATSSRSVSGRRQHVPRTDGADRRRIPAGAVEPLAHPHGRTRLNRRSLRGILSRGKDA
ncbi:MAG: hypothetical protein ACREDM_09960 [Methylocella sp.]